MQNAKPTSLITSKSTDLITAKSMTRIAKFVSALYDKPLTESQMRAVLQIASKTAKNYNKDVHAFVMDVAVAYYQQLINSPLSNITMNEYISDFIEDKTDAEVRYHQLNTNNTKSNISNNTISTTNINSVLKITNIKDLIRELRLPHSYKKSYITLDNKYAEYIKADFGTKLQWNLADVISNTPNSVITKERIKDIKQIKIYSSLVRLKRSTYVPYYFIGIDEFPEAFISGDGYKFHFAGIPQVEGFASEMASPFYNNLFFEFPRGYSPFNSSSHVPSYYTNDKYRVLFDYKSNYGKFEFKNPVQLPKTITMHIFNSDFTNAIEDTIPEYIIKNWTVDIFSIQGIVEDPSETLQSYGNITITCATPHNLMYLPFNNSDPVSGDPDDRFMYSLKIKNFTTSQPIADSYIIDFIANNEFTAYIIKSDTQLLIRPRLLKPIAFMHSRTFNQQADFTPPTTYIPAGVISNVDVEIMPNRYIYNMEITHS